MNIIKKIVSLALAMSLSLQVGALSQKLTVSARADGHYYFGAYDTNVSEYLNIRSGPDPSYSSVGRIPAGAKIYVDSVDGHMGLVSSYYYNGKSYPLIAYKSDGAYLYGWINLEYADEYYFHDEGIYGDLEDYVPAYYNNVTWRSQANTYSPALGYFPTWTIIDRGDVVNNNMGTCKIGLRTGYYNLDYMATRLDK